MDRKSASWMKREDERILEYLQEKGLATPDLISREVFEKVSPGHVSERLTVLRHADLVSKAGFRSFELTGKGEEYLEGELDVSHQPDPRWRSPIRG